MSGPGKLRNMFLRQIALFANFSEAKMGRLCLGCVKDFAAGSSKSQSLLERRI